MRISNKWGAFGTSIFTVMTQRALSAGAVNLAQGFPDFDGPEEIKDAAIRAIRNGRNQYAPSAGLPELRQLLAERQWNKYGLNFDSDREVTIFSGATEAIFCTLQALLEPGDEAVTLAPFYDSYPAAVHSAGARLISVPLDPPSWTLDPVKLEQAITRRTRILIINTPHNPTGRVLSQEELGAVRDIALRHDLLVMTDEVYEELIFDDSRHVPLACLPDMGERTVTISSTSKTFSMTGWKVGYAFAPPTLTDLLRTVHQFTVFCSATPLQVGMTAALALTDQYFDDLRAQFLERRNLLMEGLHGSGFGCQPPQGTYFVLADYSQLSELPDLEFAKLMIEKVGVATIPISVFFSDPAAAAARLKYVRFGFCKDVTTLREAARRMERL